MPLSAQLLEHSDENATLALMRYDKETQMNALEELVDQKLAERDEDLSDLAARLATEQAILKNLLAHPDQLGIDDSLALASALEMPVDDIGAAAFRASKLYAELDGEEGAADAGLDLDQTAERSRSADVEEASDVDGS